MLKDYGKKSTENLSEIGRTFDLFSSFEILSIKNYPPFCSSCKKVMIVGNNIYSFMVYY